MTKADGTKASQKKKPLRISVGLFPYDRWTGISPIVDAISLADRLGFFAVGLPEHIIMPALEDVTPVSAVWYDNFVLGATIAAATEKIQLLFNACVVPYRHPVELAKLVSTLDVASDGRVILVAGTGWMRREFRILGIPYDDRGARTDDALRALRVLWTEDYPAYNGPYFSFPPVHFLPKCVQKPHVPVWIGGKGPRPLRRAVELGEGWVPMGGTFEDIEPSILALRSRLEAAGRDPETFTFGALLPFGEPDPSQAAAAAHLGRGDAPSVPSAVSADETVDLIGRCRRVGVNHLLLHFGWRSPSQYKEMLEQFCSDIVPQV